MATNIPMNTLEHATYKGTELNELSVAGCEWRKPYNLTIPTKPTGVGAISVVRNSSQSNCDQISATTLTASGKVLYGDTITCSATAAAGYENPRVEVDSGITYASVKQKVVFPLAVETVSQYTAYTNGEVTYYIAGTSNSSIVSNLSNYTTCTIDGIEVGASSTTIKSISDALSVRTTTYSATFSNGVLTLTTIANTTLTSKPIGATTVRGDDYSTTATFTQLTPITVTGDVTLKVTAGSGKTYYVYYKQGTASSATNLPRTQTYVYPNSVNLGTNNMTTASITTDGYRVTFNYNGSGASDTTLTAINTTNYVANGWTTTNGSATRTYANGATYGGAGDLTLYPCFTPTTSLGSITLPTPTRTGYVFKGWATSSTATTGQYSGGASYTPTASVTLYAVWSPQLKAPEIISAIMEKTDGMQTSMQASLKVQNNNSCSVYYRVTWKSNDGTGVFNGPYTGSTISIGANSTEYVTGMTNASGVTYSIYFVCDGYVDSEAVTGTVGLSGSTEETTTTTTT